MTDKRFNVFKSEITGLFVVNDNTHEFAFEGVEDAGTIMKLVGLLNNYIDENEQLKKENKEFKGFIKSLCDKNNEIFLRDGTHIRLKRVFKGEWAK